MTDCKLPLWAKDGISIIIPTYKRPKGLKTALESLYQQDVNTPRFEIIVSDNDPEGGAADYINTIQETPSKADVIYVHATIPGVCNARNAAMDVVRGRYLVFVDDDMEVTPLWVQKMVDLLNKYEAGIAFSDVTARLPREEDSLHKAMVPIFSRTLDEPEGYITCFLGMGGAALDRSRMSLPNPVFDPSLNLTGGEDDILFERLSSQGVKTVWSPEFSAYEDIPESRATYDYVWKRNLAFGQGPTQLSADKGLIKGLPGILYWMAVGVAQFGVFGLQYLYMRQTKNPKAIQRYARLSQACGKVFWWDGFRPRLYGESSTTE